MKAAPLWQAPKTAREGGYTALSHWRHHPQIAGL